MNITDLFFKTLRIKRYATLIIIHFDFKFQKIDTEYIELSKKTENVHCISLLVLP